MRCRHVVGYDDKWDTSLGPVPERLDDRVSVPVPAQQSVIEKCHEGRGAKPGKRVQVPETQVKALCAAVREVFMSQNALLELEAPLKICGGVHGQCHVFLRLFEYEGFPPESNSLFLGDYYADRGKQSLETIILLFATRSSSLKTSSW